jgi:hypothetical protein
VFTSDGANPLGDAKRLHRLRRSFCKSWRNAKWRDLLLTFWHWLGEGASLVDVPMGEGAIMKLRLPPIIFDADFGIDAITDFEAAVEDEDNAEAPDNIAGDEGSDDEPEDLDDGP